MYKFHILYSKFIKTYSAITQTSHFSFKPMQLVGMTCMPKDTVTLHIYAQKTHQQSHDIRQCGKHIVDKAYNSGKTVRLTWIIWLVHFMF